jgi:hypothetical protein
MRRKTGFEGVGAAGIGAKAGLTPGSAVGSSLQAVPLVAYP